MKRPTTTTQPLPRKARRSLELFAHDSPFRPRQVPNRRGVYQRRAKHRKNDAWPSCCKVAYV